jgi:trans-aconitate 2-methyltransferase
MGQVAGPAPGSRLIQEWNGEDYERHSSQQRAWGGDLIAELTLRGDERILDLGCGDGTLAQRLAAMVPRGSVLGIDAAPEMLEAARDKCGSNMQVAVLDIRQLDFTAEFDLAFSNATLHWVQEHDTILVQIHHALRPGGILRTQFGADGNCPTFLACVRRQMAAPPYRDAFAAFRWPWFFPSLPDYEALLTASPFVEWRAWIEPKEARFPTAEALVGWIDNPCLIPFVQALPSILRQPFRDAVVADMLERTRQPDGSHLEPFRRMNVWARRSPIR